MLSFPPQLTNENDEVPTENMGDNHSPMDTNIQQGSGGRNRAPPIGVFGEENSFEIEFPVPSQYERFLSKARAVKSKTQVGKSCLVECFENVTARHENFSVD